MSKNVILKADNLYKSYTTGKEFFEALRGVSLSLEQGKMLAVMGSSGSGKSTLLHILGAMDAADRGEIWLNGELREDYGTEPKLLLADEPTGNLDYNTSIEIMQLFLELQQEQDHRIIIVTHDAMVAGYTDRILFLHDGQVCDEYRCRKNGDDMDHIVDKFKILSLKKGR